MVPCVLFAVTMSDGTLRVLAFNTESRSPTLPYGAVWLDASSHVWRRPPTADTVRFEMDRSFPACDQLGRPQPQPVSWVRTSAEALPQDRTYRNAWRHDGEQVVHDMPHARRLHLDLVRQARLEQLGRLDRDWMRATGQGKQADAATIEAARQALRDAPATLDVDAATTVDELKARWPEGLPR